MNKMKKNEIWELVEGLEELKKDFEIDNKEILLKIEDLSTKRKYEKLYCESYLRNKDMIREIDNMVWSLNLQISLIGD